MVAVWQQGDNGIVRPLCKDGRSISISQVPHVLPSSSAKQRFLIDIHVEAAALRKSTSSSSSTTTMQKATSEWPMEQNLLGRVISTTCVLCFARILCDSTAMFVEQWRCAYADAPPDTPTHRGATYQFFSSLHWAGRFLGRCGWCDAFFPLNDRFLSRHNTMNQVIHATITLHYMCKSLYCMVFFGACTYVCNIH